MPRPVLALHGFTGAGADFAPVAEPGWITPDLVGHGAEPPRAIEPYTMAAEVARLAPQVAPGTLLIGYSMGGRLALSLAVALADAGVALGGLVLVGATAGLDDPAARRARQQADAALADRIERIGVAAFLDEWSATPIIASQRRIAPAARAAMARRRLRHRPWGLANSLRGMGTGVMPALGHRLGAIACPTLLLTGADDHKFGALATRLAAGLADAEVGVIEGAGHCAHLEAPARFVARMGDWRARRGL